MMLGRRAFLAVSAAAFARPLPVAAARPVKAVAFDGLAVFDARRAAADPAAKLKWRARKSTRARSLP